jgi:hypothetical protein
LVKDGKITKTKNTTNKIYKNNMVKENIIIPKEKLTQVEEVREIENTKQQQKKLEEKQEGKSTIAESVKESAVPTVHASGKGDEAAMGAAKGIGGALLAAASIIPNPVQPAALAASAATGGTGAVMKVAGEASGEEEIKKAGDVLTDAGTIGLLPEKKGIAVVGKATTEGVTKGIEAGKQNN